MTSTSEVGSSSVTVSVTRKVDPARTDEVTAWVQSGVSLASRWPGFLGSGWIRSSRRSDEWYMLYRFADPFALSAWESSSTRKGWLDQGNGLVEERRVEKLTGIEGWFDSTQSRELLSSPPPRPARWKQAVSVWLAFFPVSLVFALLMEAVYPAWGGLWTTARVFVTTTVLTPIMTVWVLPVVTRLLRSWLIPDNASVSKQ
ncbi:antibiotic biosynthesis monooxygenase [Arthrobacter sp. D1-29]